MHARVTCCLVVLLLAPAGGSKAGLFPDDAWGISVRVQANNAAGEAAVDDSGGAGTGCSASGHLCGVTDDVRRAAISDALAEASVSLDPEEGFWRQHVLAESDGAPREGIQFAQAESDVLEKIRVDASEAGLPPDARVPVTVHLRGSVRYEDSGEDATLDFVEALAVISRIGVVGNLLSANLVLQSAPAPARKVSVAREASLPQDELLLVRLIALAQVEQRAAGSPNRLEMELAWRLCAAVPGVRIVSLSPGHDEGDLDEDVLPDCWEVAGRDVDADGRVDVDLPGMGADPHHQDLFVEVDYMVETGGPAPHSHKPDLAALQRVVDAFDSAPVDNPDGKTGIHLHVDAGPDTVMDPVTGARWGAESLSTELLHEEDLGLSIGPFYRWGDFDAVKRRSFLPRREPVFRYALFVHDLGGLGSTSGIARGIPASDFIVSLGGWTGGTGTVLQQAGTFMHELGHTLGLRHGGPDHMNYKPNFLSVMNYAFQSRGLRVAGLDGVLDYSRFELPPLDEDALFELAGIDAGPALDPGYGTVWYCGHEDGRGRIRNDANGPIDWDCDDFVEGPDPVAANVNRDAVLGVGRRSVLVSQDDWAALGLAGGAIGSEGESYVPPAETEVDELDFEAASARVRDFDVAVAGPALARIEPGEAAQLAYRVVNTGELAERFALSVEDSRGWADAQAVPEDVILDPGEEAPVVLSVLRPEGAMVSEMDSVAVRAASEVNPAVEDEARTYFVPEPPAPVSALTVLTCLAVLRSLAAGRARSHPAR